ncbi:hypothetical protein BGZ80_011438 [Entomortierella chlamydospora]|uniref:Uncharacterized protein n=1 Tax=Entomortierella chlamydospora TaxID=101097 RepID=A0A9P6N3I0_9FUNG|nr:hypothetical protein BGZ80_011438 [Entomortierella chlamydospora]
MASSDGPYVATSISTKTINQFSVSHGDASVSGQEHTDQVSPGADGVLWLGPVDLTIGATKDSSSGLSRVHASSVLTLETLSITIGGGDFH